VRVPVDVAVTTTPEAGHTEAQSFQQISHTKQVDDLLQKTQALTRKVATSNSARRKRRNNGSSAASHSHRGIMTHILATGPPIYSLNVLMNVTSSRTGR
jgi:hypothetical protein